MGLDPRRSLQCVLLFVTAALFTLVVAQLQSWPFELYQTVLVLECAFVVLRSLAAR